MKINYKKIKNKINSNINFNRKINRMNNMNRKINRSNKKNNIKNKVSKNLILRVYKEMKNKLISRMRILERRELERGGRVL